MQGTEAVEWAGRVEQGVEEGRTLEGTGVGWRKATEWMRMSKRAEVS